MAKYYATVLGDGGVGKTFRFKSIIRTINKNVILEDTNPTISYDIHTFNLFNPFADSGNLLIQNKPVQVIVYDVGAQNRSELDEEQLKDFIGSSRIIEVLVDSTNKGSIKSVEEYYSRLIKENYKPKQEPLDSCKPKLESLIILHATKMNLTSSTIDKRSVVSGNLQSIDDILNLGQLIDAKIISIGDSKDNEEYVIAGPKGIIKNPSNDKPKPVKVERAGSGIPILVGYSIINEGYSDEAGWLTKDFAKALKDKILT